MSDIIKNKDKKISIWEQIKKTGEFKDYKDISFINGKNLFSDRDEKAGEFNKSITKFISVAKRYTLISEYGGNPLNDRLEIVLKNGTWIEVSEYDGQQWFSLRKLPTKDKN